MEMRPMKFELILAVDCGDGQARNVSIGHMIRPDVSDVAMLGLSLSESKQLLAQLQREIVTRQFEATMEQRRHCGQCDVKRSIKDFHGARFRSLFGDVDLRVARLRKCRLPCKRRSKPIPRHSSASSQQNLSTSRVSWPRCCPTPAVWNSCAGCCPSERATALAPCELAPCASDNDWNRS